MGHEINVVELKRKEKKPMFAIVRTGGKQYRVSPGDKIVVEKLAGEAGDSISLGDVLLAGEGSDLKGTDGLTVAAEIIAQAKGEKVIASSTPSSGSCRSAAKVSIRRAATPQRRRRRRTRLPLRRPPTLTKATSLRTRA
jgi:ribosomal protein L21